MQTAEHRQQGINALTVARQTMTAQEN